MQHLQTKKAVSHRTIKSDFLTDRELLDLGGVKMKQSDGHGTGAVAYDCLKLFARGPSDALASKNFSLALLSAARFELSDRCQRGFVFVAKRKMKNIIPIFIQAQFGQTLRQRGKFLTFFSHVGG